MNKILTLIIFLISSLKPALSTSFSISEEDSSSVNNFQRNPAPDPLLFKITDRYPVRKACSSYILFTQHNAPMSCLHPKVLEIFDTKITKLVIEKIQKDLNETLIELNALATSSTQMLPDSFYETYKDNPLVRLLKPWAAYAIIQMQKNISYDGMDTELMNKAYTQFISIGGLETDAQFARDLGLPKLTNAQILDLLEENKDEDSSSVSANPIKEYYQRHDLYYVEKENIEESKTYLIYNIKSLSLRNSTMIEALKKHHQENKGQVFFTIGCAHAAGTYGLLWNLQYQFDIERLNSQGQFVKYIYLPLEALEKLEYLMKWWNEEGSKKS